MTTPSALAALSSDSLTARLDELAANERHALVEFLWHLAELDQRKLYLGLGFASLFDYCRDHLKLSNGSAFRRYTGARLLARFPIIGDFLGSGRLSLKRVTLLRNVLTAENHLHVLERACGGTELDVQALAASFSPKPEVKDSIRRLPLAPAPGPTGAINAQPVLSSICSDATSRAEVVFAHVASDAGPESTPTADLVSVAAVPQSMQVVTVHPSPSPRMAITAIDAERFSVKLTVGPEFIAKFNDLKSALSHVVPDGNFEDVLMESFTLALGVCAKRRGIGAKSRPAPNPEAPVAPAGSSSRHIPAAIRRAVSERDQHRCAFVGTNGRRCTSTHQLEHHHIKAYARGGPATVENLALRCRSHNQHEAVLDFGEAHIQAKRRHSLPPVEVTPRMATGATSTGGSNAPQSVH